MLWTRIMLLDGWGEAKIIGTEQDRYKCWIKEAIAIRKKGGTTMNRDEGQYFNSSTHFAITDHVVDKNHVIGWGEAKIIGTEQDRYKRWIKEAIAIRKKGGTTMNRDEGQYFNSSTHFAITDHVVDKNHVIGWGGG